MQEKKEMKKCLHDNFVHMGSKLKQKCFW